MLAACKTNEETNTAVYASNVSITQSTFTFEVGSEILFADIITITPQEAQFSVSSSNSDVVFVNLEEGKLQLLSVGTATITVSAQANGEVISYDAVVNVEERKIYASNLSFAYNTVTLNFNETSTNLLTVTLENGQTIPFSSYLHQNQTQIEFSENNLVSYNAQTGLIIPVGFNDQVKNIAVTVSVNGGDSLVTNTFNIILTNYIYAQNIEFNNINFNVVSDFVEQSSEIVLFTNSSFLLDYQPDVENFNVYPTATVESGNIEFEDSYIIAGNTAGNA